MKYAKSILALYDKTLWLKCGYEEDCLSIESVCRY